MSVSKVCVLTFFRWTFVNKQMRHCHIYIYIYIYVCHMIMYIYTYCNGQVVLEKQNMIRMKLRHKWQTLVIYICVYTFYYSCISHFNIGTVFNVIICTLSFLQLSIKSVCGPRRVDLEQFPQKTITMILKLFTKSVCGPRRVDLEQFRPKTAKNSFLDSLWTPFGS